MKPIYLAVMVGSVLTTLSLAQENGAPVVVERGPNHRKLERTTQVTSPQGIVREEKSVVTELGAGIHYRDPQTGELLESQAIIESAPGGAIAHKGQHKAAWAANINTRGAVQLATDDGVVLRSHVLGVGYTDAASGKSVLLAEVKDSIGEIVAPNQIVYSDCLTDFKADLKYTYTRSGFEQDLVLWELPATTPQDYGMNPATTRLELYTEVIDPPKSSVSAEGIKTTVDAQAQPLALGSFTDQSITFGALKIGRGKAFDLQGASESIPVGKSWIQTQDGRHCLVEAVEYNSLNAALIGLPKAQAKVAKPAKELMAKLEQGTVGARFRTFPQGPRPDRVVSLKPMQKVSETAQLLEKDTNRNAFVLDYVVTLSAGVSNYTFNGDGTYYVSGPVTLTGTTTINGGAVIKYNNASNAPSLFFDGGTVVCNTTPFNQALLTAKDDNSEGDFVTGSGISGFYGAPALNLSNTKGDIHDLKIKYASQAYKSSATTNRVSNLQILNCKDGIEALSEGSIPAHNILAENITGTLFWGSSSTWNAQHVTASQVARLSDNSASALTLTLTNCILYNVTNIGGGIVSGDYLATNLALTITGVTHTVRLTNSPFQSVLGGHYYLLTNSFSLLDAGTTNIDLALKAELPLGTTVAPIYYTNLIQTTQTWSTAAQKDTGAPDYGYHYAPMDYIISGLTINTNGLLVMTNGACVGVDYGASGWGLVFDGGKLTSEGSAKALNHLLRAHCIQENSSGNPGTRSMLYDKGDSGTHGNAEARFRFTEITQMAQDGYDMYTGKNFSAFEMSHCVLNQLVLIISANKGSQVYGITNSVAEWAQLNFDSGGTSSLIHLRNNLFRNWRLDLVNLTNTSTVKDNIFDTSDAFDNGRSVSNGWNAYFGTTNYLTGRVSDTNLVSLTYEVGPLGKYYQPTNSPLINRGSLTNAGLVGLYHFTSTTNQVKETNTVLNIGNHYVALNASGNPVDTDGDGVADYQEDRNGNGTADAGESNWLAQIFGGEMKELLELLQGKSLLSGTGKRTSEQFINLQVYTPLR